MSAPLPLPFCIRNLPEPVPPRTTMDSTDPRPVLRTRRKRDAVNERDAENTRTPETTRDKDERTRKKEREQEQPASARSRRSHRGRNRNATPNGASPLCSRCSRSLSFSLSFSHLSLSFSHLSFSHFSLSFSLSFSHLSLSFSHLSFSHFLLSLSLRALSPSLHSQKLQKRQDQALLHAENAKDKGNLEQGNQRRGREIPEMERKRREHGRSGSDLKGGQEGRGRQRPSLLALPLVSMSPLLICNQSPSAL